MKELHVGRGITRGAMTVFPLWGRTNCSLRYTMGGESLDVTEVEGGPNVGTLMVGNTGDRPELVLEGQLFEGGWQHRMASRSVMIGVHQRIEVEVACVEQGRWSGAVSHQSRGRRATPFVRDSLRHGGDVQAELWSRVAVHSEDPDNTTGSLVHRLDRAESEHRTWSDLRPLPGQIGVLIGIGGQPIVAETFNSTRQLRTQLQTILESAALDAALVPQIGTPSRRARRFIERLDRVRLHHVEPAGIAEGWRGATEHADVSTLRWQQYDVHSRMTNVRHPMLMA